MLVSFKNVCDEAVKALFLTPEYMLIFYMRRYEVA